MTIRLLNVIICALQVTVNGDVEAEVEKVTETLGELQFEEEEDENAFYTKVSLILLNGMKLKYVNFWKVKV